MFGDLKELCALTDGNLSRHLRILEKAGLVEVWKGFRERRPQTLCHLSPKGRERFVAYLEELENVFRDAAAVREKSKHATILNEETLPKDWAPA